METECSQPVCQLPVRAKGLCIGHLNRKQRGGDMSKPVRTRAVFTAPKPETCTLNDCERPYHVKGMCLMHYHRARRGQDMDSPPLRKNDQARRVGKDGYVNVPAPDHPDARSDGWIFEHRLVMERKIGRYLLPGENVHHKNRIRSDNRPENLELWVKTQPSGARAIDMLAWAREVVELYEPLELAEAI